MDELLRILRTNALESHETIGRMLGVPTAEVSARIQDYEKRGMIRGASCVIVRPHAQQSLWHSQST